MHRSWHLSSSDFVLICRTILAGDLARNASSWTSSLGRFLSNINNKPEVGFFFSLLLGSPLPSLGLRFFLFSLQDFWC